MLELLYQLHVLIELIELPLSVVQLPGPLARGLLLLELTEGPQVHGQTGLITRVEVYAVLKRGHRLVQLVQGLEENKDSV